ncbi:MAG TPA: FecR family protein [Rubrivivax sp.]
MLSPLHALSALLARSIAVGALALAGSGMLHAEPEDPPGRVGRLADMAGRVSMFDAEEGQWVEAQRNRALTTGDRLSTEQGARAEVRIGSTVLRLGGNSELEFARVDDERMVFQLHTGSVALRVRSREIADEVEVRTGEGRALPERSGHYRIDREDDTTFVATLRGSLRFDAGDLQVQVPAGRRAEFFQQSGDRATVVAWSAPGNDDFAQWVAREDQRDERSVAQRYVSPEMTGVEDLDRYGRWENHPEYGVVWSPLQVAVGWAPYRYGRWGWRARWGWTWIDNAPWGFAPFHYGRWVSWGGRWVWSPGAYVARPVFAPALVAWVGGPNVSVSINLGGGPTVGWVPLAPRDVYVPGFRYGQRYFDQVNRPQHPHQRPQVPTGPVMYGNRGVPGAVTVVPSNVLTQRQPVAPAAVRDADAQRAIGGARVGNVAPVLAPTGRFPAASPGAQAGSQTVTLPQAPGRKPPPSRPVVDLRRAAPMPASPSAQPAPQATAAATAAAAVRAMPPVAPRAAPPPQAAPQGKPAPDRGPDASRKEASRDDRPEARQRIPESRPPSRERQNAM